MERPNRNSTAYAGFALMLALAGCGTDAAQLQGRYFQRGAWLEFRNGIVIHGELGDSVPYRVDGTTIVLSGPAGSVEGQVVSPATLRFTGGNGAMADAFAGVWVAQDLAATKAMEGAEARAAAEAIVGQWRVPGETDASTSAPMARTRGVRVSAGRTRCSKDSGSA